MAKKIFRTDKLEQVKERTTNMFQQCGGSYEGRRNENPVGVHGEPPYQYPSTASELKICTLESTYRRPMEVIGSRRFVSDSDIFRYRDQDWYREPKYLDPNAIYSAPLKFEMNSARYPSADICNAENVSAAVAAERNVFVRFRSFLGIDGSTQRVDVITGTSDYYPEERIPNDEGGIVRMKTLFGRKNNSGTGTFQNDIATDNSTRKIDRFKNLFTAKRSKKKETITPIETEITGNKIIRMKNFFGSKNARPDIEANGSESNVFRLKTLFRRNDKTASVAPSACEAPRVMYTEADVPSVAIRFKKLFRTQSVEKNVPQVGTDERQVFSRQSINIPARVEEDEPRPVCVQTVVQRIRAALSGAGLDHVEIAQPNPETLPSEQDARRRRFGSTARKRYGCEAEKRPSGCRRFFSSYQDVRLTFCPSAREAAAQDYPAPFTQVIALICGILVVILMALGLGSADWLMAAGWRQGLFNHCIEPFAPTPLPFNLNEEPGCYSSREVGYIRSAAALCIVTLIADIIGVLLTALGLRATDHRVKYKFYRFAVLAMTLALIAILIALVIYPVCFAAELNLGNRTVWEFGWAYGVGWGAAIFLFGAVILLMCDKESEEIYYKERKVEREPPGGVGGGGA